MIKPFTLLCLAAAFGSGLYLYSEKHRTAMLDRDINHVVRDTQAARARTGLLRAEWALLNEPGRLQEMADRYLHLTSMAPTQFVQLADLGSRLPPPDLTPPPAPDAASTTDGTTPGPDGATPGNSGAAGAPDAGTDIPLASNGPAWGVAGDAHAALPASAPAAPTLAAAHPPVKLAARVKQQHRTQLAARQDSGIEANAGSSSLLPRGTPLPLASPQPARARVISAMAHAMPVMRHQTPIVAPVAPATYLGSALGGRGSLPPPVPLGSDGQ